MSKDSEVNNLEGNQRSFNLAKRKLKAKCIVLNELTEEEKRLVIELNSVVESAKRESIKAGMIVVQNDLKEFKHEIEKIEDLILENASSDDVAETESVEIAKCKRVIRESLASLQEHIVKIEKQVSSSEKGSSSVKLPTLDIRKFSGEPTQWRSFWESFQAAVGKRAITDVEKFNYLKGYLEGKAASAIAGFELTEENYIEACKILEERFGKPQLIILNHMDNLMQLKPVNSSEEVKQLRAVYDKIETNVRSLQGLGITHDRYGVLLVSVILNKVPIDIRLIITRQFESESWTFETLLRAFKMELEAREKCITVSQNSEQVKKRNFDHKTTGALLTKGFEVKCTYCRMNHPSANCDVVKDISKRREIVRQGNRCFVCLRIGHQSRYCRDERKCKTCHGRHHTSLCTREMVNETNVALAQAKTSSLLQTAKVYASTGQKKVLVRLIFDLGSNDSYITAGLKAKLNLKEIGGAKNEDSRIWG